MGACYSTSNQIETTNSSTKRPYDKTVNRKQTKSNLTSFHLLTPSYLATINNNNQLIQINNQTHVLKPKNSILDESNLQISKSTNQLTKMYENKSKLMSKLPKFNSRRVHDSSIQRTSIAQFGVVTAKQTLNADLIRLKNGFDGAARTTTNNKQSSNSSLTNSETSCGSSSNSSFSTNQPHQNRKSNHTFIKATSATTLNDRKKVISKQPTKSSSSLNQHSLSNHRLNCVSNKQHAQQTSQQSKTVIDSSSVQFSQALTKLPATSKYTTTITNLPKPQIAQRVLHSRTSNNTGLSNVTSLDAQRLRPTQLSSTLRPYSLKKPYTRTTTSQEANLGINSTIRYPYHQQETNLKTNSTRIGYHSAGLQVPNQNDDKVVFKSSIPSNRKLASSLPVPNCGSICGSSNGSLRTSKNERRYSPQPATRSNEQINETSKSLTLNDNSKLMNFEKENTQLSTSFESSFLGNKTSPTAKELSDRISQVKSINNKLLNHQFNNQNSLNSFSNSNNKRSQIKAIHKQPLNSLETTEDSNSIHEPSCTNSQKSNSPNASLTPDLSNASKISPEHNNRSENQIYLDDEICDQPDLLFLNSKENSTSTSPVKENICLVDNLINTEEQNKHSTEQECYRTNIRYSISELDSLKLKQELLMSPSFKIDEQKNENINLDNQLLSSVSSSPEKSTSLQSPVRATKFRKPRPLSYVESENGSLALDNSSFRSVLQDINGIKTLLFRLQGELQKSETQNPFENILNASQTNKDQSSNCVDSWSEDRCGFLMNNDQLPNRNESLEIENQNLKKQLALMQQKMDDKDRTIRLLQQQMTKYLNINESSNLSNKKTSNSATQTDRTDYNRTLAPQEQKTSNGIVVSFFIRNHTLFNRSSSYDRTDSN